VLLSKWIVAAGTGDSCRAARRIHKPASKVHWILGQGTRCKKARRGGSLARDKPTWRWSKPCRAVVNRGRAQAWRWNSRKAHEGNGSRKRAGHWRGEIPRGPNTRRAAVVGSWLTPRPAVANPRREQSLEGEAVRPKVLGATRDWQVRVPTPRRSPVPKGVEGSAGGKGPEGKP